MWMDSIPILCNLFTIILQLVRQIYCLIISFIHLMWMDFIPILCNLFAIILQLVWQIYPFIISFIHLNKWILNILIFRNLFTTIYN